MEAGEDAVGAHEKHDEEDQEKDGVAELRGEVADGQRFHHAEEQACDQRAGNAAETAEHAKKT